MSYRSPRVVTVVNGLKTSLLVGFLCAGVWLKWSQLPATPAEPVAQLHTATPLPTASVPPEQTPSATPIPAVSLEPAVTIELPTLTYTPPASATHTKPAGATPTTSATKTPTSTPAAIANSVPLTPTFDIPIISVAGQPMTITGTAGEDGLVRLTVNKEVWGELPVDQNGQWVYTTTIKMPGTYPVELTLVNEDGEVVAQNLISLTVGGTNTPLGEVQNPEILYPRDTAEIEGFKINLYGTAAPRSVVEILSNGEVVGVVYAADNGNWSYLFYKVLPDQTYSLTARIQGRLDTESTAITVTLREPDLDYTCGEPESGQDLGDRYVVGKCEWLTRIARDLNIDYFTLLEYNPQITDPSLILPGQVLKLPPRE